MNSISNDFFFSRFRVFQRWKGFMSSNDKSNLKLFQIIMKQLNESVFLYEIKGDSGGPLTTDVDGQYILVGLVSN